MEEVVQSIEVNAPIELCYRLWSHFEEFPQFMHYVKSVQHKASASGDQWHWTVAGPFGKTLEWDAIITEIEPCKVISWRSLEHSTVDTSGSVNFHPLDNCRTRLDVVMAYEPPGSILGELIADLFQNPQNMVNADLQQFKKLAEQTFAQTPIFHQNDSF